MEKAVLAGQSRSQVPPPPLLHPLPMTILLICSFGLCCWGGRGAPSLMNAVVSPRSRVVSTATTPASHIIPLFTFSCRGTPEAPGRVVTLLRASECVCFAGQGLPLACNTGTRLYTTHLCPYRQFMLSLSQARRRRCLESCTTSHLNTSRRCWMPFIIAKRFVEPICDDVLVANACYASGGLL